MATKNVWRQQSKYFFNERAAQISTAVNTATLCFVSGREQRLWNDPAMYQDLIDSIQAQLSVGSQDALLEVGCAAGFLAQGLAQRCGRYTGIDIAPSAVEVARTLKIARADFQVADGTRLPWPADSFDRVLCHFVFTNFPDFASIAQVLREMVRVTRTGGKIMAGSLPDDAGKAEFEKLVPQVNRELDRLHGPAQSIPNKLSLLDRARGWLLRRVKRIQPQVVCYYCKKADFLALGRDLGLRCEIFDSHPLDPFRGYRFNVVYTK